MAMLLKVQWVDKMDGPDACQCVRHIGGSRRELHWKHSQAEAIRAIEEGEFTYYIETGAVMSALDVGVCPEAHKYLKAEADIDHPHHLVNLPTFPVVPPKRGIRAL